MKVGMMIPNYARWLRGDEIWEVCDKAKQLGVDALCFVDHVIVTPHQYVGYGNGYMDIWTAMSYVAAITNIQGWKPILTQSVCVIPYRPAVQQAKVAATVDSLSGGRLMLGVGSGYNENEFSTLGLNVRERGSLTDEYLACMKELWTQPVASFNGKYVNFEEMTISVRPAQQPHPPILYGSHGPRPRQRIAERYQGSIHGTGVQDTNAIRAFESDMGDLNRLWNEYGRSGKPYIMSIARTHLTMDRGKAGQEVIKGIVREGNPDWPGHVGGRMKEGEERPYVSPYPIVHADDLVDKLRTDENLGVDLAIVWLPSYRYGGFSNLQMQIDQMEIFGEHVLPKINRDKKKPEFDYGGKSFTPMV